MAQKPKIHTLTDTWLHVRAQRHGETKTQAVRALNAQLGTRYTLSRINEWVSGEREPMRRCRMAMLDDVLPFYFSGAQRERNPSDWADLAEMLA